DVGAELAAVDAEADEGGRAVDVLVAQEAVDFLTELQVRAVVAEQRDAVRDPVLADEPVGPLEPVAQDREESPADDLGGSVEPGGEGGDGLLVAGEEEPLLAAEVLEDGALRDRELGGDVLDAGGMVAALGEVPHRGLEDSGALGLGAHSGRRR